MYLYVYGHVRVYAYIHMCTHMCIDIEIVLSGSHISNELNYRHVSPDELGGVLIDHFVRAVQALLA